MKKGDKIFFTNRIGQTKRATIVNILQDDRVLVATDDEKDKTYVTSEKHCDKVCEWCDGTGVITIPAYPQAGEIVEEVNETCTICKGTGIEIYI